MQQETTLTAQRNELKFFLSRADYEYARNMLCELMHCDEYASEDGYPLRSLYFDTIADESVIEKLDGVESRDKYRLRSYGSEYPWVKLERKRKYNDYVSKTSVVLSNDDARALMNGDYHTLLQHDAVGARSIYFDFARQYLHPVALIDYIREPYTLPYNEIRVTFDKNISVSTDHLDMFDWNAETRQIQSHEVVIMEVKYNVCLPSWFKDVLSFESGTSAAIGKYVIARLGAMDYVL